MNSPNDSNSSMIDSEAYKQMELDIEIIVTSAGFGLQNVTMIDAELTLETPFHMNRIYFSDYWIEQHLSPEDFQKFMSISLVFDFWYVHLFHEERNPKGVEIYYAYMPFDKYREVDFTFLMEHGNEETKHLYRLPALYSKGTGLPVDTLDQGMFLDSIYQTGDKLAEELNEKLTVLVTPLYQQLEARIEVFKEKFKEGVNPGSLQK